MACDSCAAVPCSSMGSRVAGIHGRSAQCRCQVISVHRRCYERPARLESRVAERALEERRLRRLRDGAVRELDDRVGLVLAGRLGLVLHRLEAGAGGVTDLEVFFGVALLVFRAAEGRVPLDLGADLRRRLEQVALVDLQVERIVLLRVRLGRDAVGSPTSAVHGDLGLGRHASEHEQEGSLERHHRVRRE